MENKKEIKYYCPYCKEWFNHWSVGHAYTYVNLVCAGGCNTQKKKMLKLQAEQEFLNY